MPGRLEVVPGGLLTAAAWETVYREHVGAVYRFVLSRLGNRPDAEDVTATVFERALPRLQAGAPSGQMRAYLINTARTTIADHWRERHGVALVAEIEVATIGAENATGEDREGEVGRVLERLPANYREVLELRFLRGYSLKETAASMSTSVANVKVLQLRALRRAASEFDHE